ncbi:MAG: ATP-dependent RecD-like DNA helicase [Syntrophobacteraceae bacterium]|nr:ATP-dependent RecD-like DNA helicase [Syntrophobacteraceae bacterium]
MTQKLHGRIERITYSNEENGYCVLRVKLPGQKVPITVVGNFVSVTPGEVLRMEGDWDHHSRFGLQFKVDRYETAAPDSVEGIRKYLGSGLIKGIGPVMATRVVSHFGEKTLEVIDLEPHRLLDVEGIGAYRLRQIQKAWEDQKDIRELMVFLRGHGVSAGYAVRIFKHYGKGSLDVVKENPYRLAMEVPGIGFLSADKIAGNLGFAVDSPLRAEGGVFYLLQQAMDEGHACVPRSRLLEKCGELLEIPAAILESALDRLIAGRHIVAQPLSPEVSQTFGDKTAIYLRGLYLAETQVAKRLVHLKTFQALQRKVDQEEALRWLQKELPFRLAPLQEEAVRRVLTDKVVVITGGPGTGKTTLVRAILAVFKRMKAGVCLAAPTGRAAKRLSEATHYTARTIHRVLEFSPQGGFQRNEQKPLPADLVLVDETSMVDILLLHHLLKAVSPHATLVLVGDADQLPSVGPGNVLQEIVRSGQFPVVRLTEIFRQARESKIIVNAHLVQQGKFPVLRSESRGLQDFYFIQKEDPEEAVQVILRLCSERIPARFHLDPVDEIQVLSPMHRGVIGTQRLNSLLQEALNPQTVSLERGGQVFRVQDKVMQIRNNYDKDVFNGDLGRIRKIDTENQEVHVEMDGRRVVYDFSEMDELVLAYAVTVHKAQGSEYPAVVLPLLTQHYMMLQRNLLYTAITRARKLMVLVGSTKALAIAINNDKLQHRFSLLGERLMGLPGLEG